MFSSVLQAIFANLIKNFIYFTIFLNNKICEEKLLLYYTNPAYLLIKRPTNKISLVLTFNVIKN